MRNRVLDELETEMEKRERTRYNVNDPPHACLTDCSQLGIDIAQ